MDALQAGAARVLARTVDQPGPLATPCRIFTGYRNRDGYGSVSVAGAKLLAHRVVYAATVGDPTGLDVHHRCDQPACVNTDHLQAMTRLEHVHVSDSPSARWARRDRCAAGHPLTGSRRRGDRRGHRRCLVCHRDQERARRARLRAAA